MSKTVIVTGISGMDGSNMVDFLLANTDVNVIGIVRHLSNENWKNFRHNIGHERFEVVEADITDAISISYVVEKYKPEYFINFAGASFVGNSWSQPVVHMNTNAMAVLYILEAIKKYSPKTRFYQANSSEMFGDVKYSPQDEKHPFSPRSVYAVSKVAAHYLCKVYRESYGIFAISGTLFNHEGRRRNEIFVTRKITKGVARIVKAIKQGKPFDPIYLGNLDAKRDWSDSDDFVEAVWLMLNQDEARDYLLSSGETHSVREFVEKAFAAAGLTEATWSGEGINECYSLNEYLTDIGELKSFNLVKVAKEFFRPNEVELLHGDSTKARKELNWQPKISFDELVARMVEWDIQNN
jgi:GDPmannose 4,6-dehydratase